MANRYWVGGSGTWDALNLLNWSTASGGVGGATVPTSADTVFFDGNSGAGTVTLSDNKTVLRCLLGNSFTGTLAFNGKKISIAGSGATVFSGSTLCSITGSPDIELTYSGSVGTRTVTTYDVTESQAFNISVIAGTDTIAGLAKVKALNFTGFSGTLQNLDRTIFGALTLSTGMTLSAGSGVLTFSSTSASLTHTFNGKTLPFPVVFNSPNCINNFADALNADAVTFNAGTVNFKSGTTNTFPLMTFNGLPFVSISATIPGSAATISQPSGLVYAANTSFKDISVIGNVSFNAFYFAGNVNNGNNSGIDFFAQIGKFIYTSRKNKRVLY